jgi:hypothetical protein
MSRRQELIEILDDMSDEEFGRLDIIDLRNWYYAKINGEYQSCWSNESELENLKELYNDVEFELIPLKESMR